jgi:two-component system LytT family sensor kinase
MEAGDVMLVPAAPQLLHIVGLVTGAALYAMLLWMALRAQDAGDRLTVVTGLLGLAWNIGELGVLALGESFQSARAWTAAASYGALGFLAAVVVHSAARVSSPHKPLRVAGRLVVYFTYGSALGAAVLQAGNASSGAPLPSAEALTLLTGSLAVLTPALIVSTGAQATDRRAFWMIALTLFAVSAVHLGSFHGPNESWIMELAGHHASIPLAFAMLYQDYRFAFADLFLKHAFTLIALVAIVYGTWSLLAPVVTSGAPSQAAIGALLVAWTLTALLFPLIRRGITRFVDRVVLGRADYAAFAATLGSALQACSTEHEALDCACAALAPALSASAVAWEPATPPLPPGASQRVAVPTGEPPGFVLVIGRLAGGRRLLSDDLEMLERTAFHLARRIDLIRRTGERHARALHDRELRALATEAELRALRAQVNPHFLFNALTTLGYLIQHAPARALDTLMRLTSLLRTVLRADGEFTTLGRERELIENYLSIEHERFEERLQVTLDIPDALADWPIPSLLVQPLVENAVKHGIARARTGGLIEITASVEPGDGPDFLMIDVRNSGARLGASYAQTTGVGLHNVRQRLHYHYGDQASLSLEAEPDGTTLARLRLPASPRGAPETVAGARDATW